MRTSRSSVILPLPVRHALRKLGRDIRDARRRRRIPAAIAAQRASISRTTLVKIEKGDPGVAIGIYASNTRRGRAQDTIREVRQNQAYGFRLMPMECRVRVERKTMASLYQAIVQQRE